MRDQTWYLVLKGPPATGAGDSTWAGDDAKARAPTIEQIRGRRGQESFHKNSKRQRREELPMETARGQNMEVARRSMSAFSARLLHLTRHLLSQLPATLAAPDSFSLHHLQLRKLHRRCPRSHPFGAVPILYI